VTKITSRRHVDHVADSEAPPELEAHGRRSVQNMSETTALAGTLTAANIGDVAEIRLSEGAIVRGLIQSIKHHGDRAGSSSLQVFKRMTVIELSVAGEHVSLDVTDGMEIHFPELG
jgi:hypothetical protein